MIDCSCHRTGNYQASLQNLLIKIVLTLKQTHLPSIPSLLNKYSIFQIKSEMFCYMRSVYNKSKHFVNFYFSY